MLKWVLVATIMFVYALGIEAQGVLTADAMIRVAEQKAKVEHMAVDRKRVSPAQQPALPLVVKVDDEKAADIFFCQERKPVPETRNTILVPRARSIIDKTAVSFKVILPSYLDKLLLVASPFSGLFK